jgi:hypothetical protein
MAKSFTYKFDELPLLIVDGLEVCLISGSVDIEYDRGGWCLVPDSICVEGYKRLSFAERDAGVSPWVYVKAPIGVSRTISRCLENEWRDRVQSAVEDQIDEDREAAADDYADMKLSERMMGLV